MRIWSLHPKYLDTKGLVALWRETLLAKKVLEGNIKGYKNHPQLNRFKAEEDPLKAINFYLHHVWLEADSRNYKFDKDKFEITSGKLLINVTKGQLEYEKNHLLKKLKVRDVQKYIQLNEMENYDMHPLFKQIEGGIEPWEII